MNLKPPQDKICEPILWEAHACLPLLPGHDMSALSVYRKAGFHHVSVNVGMDMTPFADVIRVLAGFRRWLLQNESEYVLAGTVVDIQRARGQHKLAVSFDLEGANMLCQDVAMVELFAKLGVRQMLLAYNRDNSCAGGCHGAGGGLTPLGREVVSEINRSGIVMDCSHASKRSSLEIMELSRRPVIFSHTNVKAIHDHPRTIDDEQILACAAQDGVIGLTGLGTQHFWRKLPACSDIDVAVARARLSPPRCFQIPGGASDQCCFIWIEEPLSGFCAVP